MTHRSKELIDLLSSKFSKSDQICIISIQGPSTSGKSTLSKILWYTLLILKQKCYVLNLDSFIRTKQVMSDYYDYDNPGVYQWEKIRNVLTAFHDKHKTLDLYEYSFSKSQSTGPIVRDNPFPKFLIVEGLHANYLFSDWFFNLEIVKPTVSADILPQEDLFVREKTNWPNFSVLKLQLRIEKEKMYKVRLKRDACERGLDLDTIKRQLCMVWAATELWVFNDRITQPDITLDNGTFGMNGLAEFLNCFVRFLISKSEFTHEDWVNSPYKIPNIKKFLSEREIKNQ